MNPVDVVNQWFELYNDGTAESYGSTTFVDLYADDFFWVEKPSAFSPVGRSGDANVVREGVANASTVLVNRAIKVEKTLVDGENVATLGTWSATVSADGLGHEIGTVLSMSIAQFFTVRDGKITSSVDVLANPDPA